MATRDQLRNYARQQTLLDTSDITDAEIDTYLNRAVATVGARFPWPFLQASDDFDTVVDQQNYAKPTGCKFIDAINEEGARVRLREVDPLEQWQRYGDSPPSGKARSFYLWEDEIWLGEIPTSVVTYKIFYRTSPSLGSLTSDTPPWDSQFHWFLGDYAAAKIWEREEDTRQMGVSMQLFEEGLGEMAAFYVNEASDYPLVWGEKTDRLVGNLASNVPWIDGV